MLAMTIKYCLRKKCTRTQKNKYAIIYHAPHRNLMGDILATMYTTVHRAMTSLNYYADKSVTATIYYLSES